MFLKKQQQEKNHTDVKTSLKLTLLRDEVRENAVQRAAVCQVIQRSRAVWDEQRLVSGTLKGVIVTQVSRW